MKKCKCIGRFKGLFFLLFIVFQLGGLSYPLEAGIKKKYKLVACAVFQNEDFFLKEWIEYHRLVGVEHFYLFNNNSTDNYAHILKPYIEEGVVELFDWTAIGTNQSEHSRLVQIPAYKRALAITKLTAEWAAFIDLDEFIVPVKHTNLVEFLKDYKQYGGVVINWQIFGTSWVNSLKTGELITERLTFKKQSDDGSHHMVKSIVQPKKVKDITDPHSFFFIDGYTAVNSRREPMQPGQGGHPTICLEDIQINHYWFGTRDWFVHNKLPRRAKWGIVLDDPQTLEAVIAGGNIVEDLTMARFLPALKQAMLQKKVKKPLKK